jgi:hypothetical protein
MMMEIAGAVRPTKGDQERGEKRLGGVAAALEKEKQRQG